MMLTESYLKTDPASVRRERQEDAAAAERETLLLRTGLTARLKTERETASHRNRMDVAGTLYPELRGRELRTWRRFLPTTYDIDKYVYDEVPVEALRHIKTAQELGCFDKIIIWTPENNTLMGLLKRRFDAVKDRAAEALKSMDPMAVGVIEINDTTHFYPIARWGESLLPLKKIQAKVRRVRAGAFILGLLVPALLVGLAIASYLNGIAQHGFGPMIAVTVFSIIGLIFLIGMASGDL